MSVTQSTYLALGDSYTIGEGVPEYERWPVMLAEKKGWKNPKIIATTGWTSSELLDGIAKTDLATSYDWISILIGVNNQYRGQSINDYHDDLNQLAELMLSLVGYHAQRIFMLSIPDYGVTPFAIDKNPDQISRELAHFNKVNRDYAQQRGFQYCDITRQSLLAEDQSEYLVEDQLHPSGLMYELWVQEILTTCNFDQTY